MKRLILAQVMRNADHNRWLAEKSATHWWWSCVMRYPGRNSNIFRMALLQCLVAKKN
jgi:hypothetical protein